MKTISIGDDAYKLLSDLKQSERDSFSKVILRHVRIPADTCGELLDRLEKAGPPEVDEDRLNILIEQRGRK